MPYDDTRLLSAKLAEHRFWNTLEIHVESAGVGIARQLIKAANCLPSPFSWEGMASNLCKVAYQEDEETILGIIRLLVFSANETPNRFKAIFPAYLIQYGHASVNDSGMSWAGMPRAKAANITIEKLSSAINGGGTSSAVAISAFIDWAKHADASFTLDEISSGSIIPENLLTRIAYRLAQGADTNRRGHGATDILKSRLEVIGFSPDIGNTNKSDVPVTNLVDTYSGPRKYDTVLWDAKNRPIITSQSQMYSSDVGSIQGKTIEEDSTPNGKMKTKWKNIVILTHTEGFGCHTTMLARLKHVLNSNIDGFIQLKTFDTKLRRIIRMCKCSTLTDFDMAILLNSGASNFGAIKNYVIKKLDFDDDEVEIALQRYIKKGFYKENGSGNLEIPEERKLKTIYFFILDSLYDNARALSELDSTAIRIGGKDIESGLEKVLFRKILEDSVALFQLNSSESDEIRDSIMNSPAIFIQ